MSTQTSIPDAVVADTQTDIWCDKCYCYSHLQTGCRREQLTPRVSPVGPSELDVVGSIYCLLVASGSSLQPTDVQLQPKEEAGRRSTIGRALPAATSIGRRRSASAINLSMQIGLTEVAAERCPGRARHLLPGSGGLSEAAAVQQPAAAPPAMPPRSVLRHSPPTPVFLIAGLPPQTFTVGGHLSTISPSSLTIVRMTMTACDKCFIPAAAKKRVYRPRPRLYGWPDGLVFRRRGLLEGLYIGDVQFHRTPVFA